MSLYPIKVTRETLQYQSSVSDKEYHFVAIETADNRCILVTRFGRSGTWGTMDANTGTPVAMWRVYNKKHGEKTRKGYALVRRDESEPIETLDQLKSNLGSYFHHLKSELETLLGVTLVTGSAAAAAPPVLEDKPRPIPAPPAPKPLTEAERYKDNPLWGAF